MVNLPSHVTGPVPASRTTERDALIVTSPDFRQQNPSLELSSHDVSGTQTPKLRPSSFPEAWRGADYPQRLFEAVGCRALDEFGSISFESDDLEFVTVSIMGP